MSDEQSSQTGEIKKDDAGGGGSGNGGSSSELINIIVKTSKERETFQIASNASIKQLRELVSERYKVEPAKVCLIFSGKILKDGDTLESHKMKDGYIVHLVIRDVSKLPASSAGGGTTTTTTTSTAAAGSHVAGTGAAPATDTAGSGSTGGGVGPFPPFSISGMIFNPAGGAAGVGIPGLEGFNQQLAQQMNNPEFMRQMMESPVMQSLYSNPEVFRSIISNNPHFQQLIERNPELNHVLSNPEIVRQTFDMMRNPAAFQELMRSHDRALSNLESLPGGYNALRRMYTELQEPMLNAAQEQFVGNPFATNNAGNTGSGGGGGGTGSGSTTPSNTENREPLPNPWQRSDGGSAPAAATGGSPTVGANTGGNRTSNLPFGNMMEAAMQQMADNPNLLNTLMNSPMMQSMMQQMASNPQMATQILQQQQHLFENPASIGGAAAPPLIDSTRIISAINSLSRNLQNPLYQRIVGNMPALQAYLQVETGLEQLERILGVPNASLLELFAIGSSGRGGGATPQTTTTASSTSSTTTSQTTSSSMSTSATTGTTNTAPASAPIAGIGAGLGASGIPPAINPNMLSQMMQQMFSGAPAENRYQAQLSQLEAMGFTNRQANLQALMETFGNLEAAIDRLLSRM